MIVALVAVGLFPRVLSDAADAELGLYPVQDTLPHIDTTAFQKAAEAHTEVAH